MGEELWKHHDVIYKAFDAYASMSAASGTGFSQMGLSSFQRCVHGLPLTIGRSGSKVLSINHMVPPDSGSSRTAA